MTYKKIAFPICIASAVLMLSACGGGSSGTSTVTGTFEDGAVYNLPYTCSPSDISGITDLNGEFTCNEGDTVSFHIGSTTLGPIAAKADELITPYKLFPNDHDQAIRLSQLLLSLDDDGDYTERITLTSEYLALIAVEIDFDSVTFDDDVQAMLDDANLTLIDAQTAEDHLHASDTELPIVTLLGEPEVIIEVGNAYMDPGATAYDEFEGRLDPVRTGIVDTNTIGIYMYTYTATDAAGNVGTATRQIVVLDTTVPVVTLNGDPVITIGVGESYTDAGATATDNVDGTLTPVMSGSVNTAVAGTYTITWTATDTAGNVGTVERTVVVQAGAEDVIPPIVTLNGDVTVTINVGDSYTDAGATATDNVDGTLTPVMSGSVNTAVEGTYTITWTATDIAGNVGTAERTVIVGVTSTSQEELEASEIGDTCIDTNGDTGVVAKDTDPFGNPIPGTATCVAEAGPTPTTQEELEASEIGDTCIDTNGDTGVVAKDTDPFGNPIPGTATCVVN